MNRININLTLNDGYTLPARRMEDEYNITGLTINHRTYYEVKHYCNNIGNISDSTVRRLLKKVEHRNCNDYFIKVANKIFVSPSITMLADEHFSKTDTINGNWEQFLRSHTWDYFGCVSFRWSISLNTAKERMTSYFERLGKKYKTAELRLFYVCEQNKTRDGYHVHFVLWTDVKDKAQVRSFTENHFRGKAAEPFANTKIEKYDPNEGGIGYLLKEVAKNPDGYDYLYKNNEG